MSKYWVYPGPYSFQIGKMRTKKNSVSGHFLRIDLNREPIKTFDRFECLLENESLNEIPEANDLKETLVSCNKNGKSHTQDKNKQVQCSSGPPVLRLTGQTSQK